MDWSHVAFGEVVLWGVGVFLALVLLTAVLGGIAALVGEFARGWRSAAEEEKSSSEP
ncbi:hypothetical protein JCM18899A_08220 [Nocardioides sp. AN3]